MAYRDQRVLVDLNHETMIDISIKGGDFKLGDLMLGDFSLGSREPEEDDELPYLVGDTMLNLARSGLPCLRPAESRGEIWLGRNKRSVLLLRSPVEVDKTSCANLKK